METLLLYKPTYPQRLKNKPLKLKLKLKCDLSFFRNINVIRPKKKQPTTAYVTYWQFAVLCSRFEGQTFISDVFRPLCRIIATALLQIYGLLVSKLLSLVKCLFSKIYGVFDKANGQVRDVTAGVNSDFDFSSTTTSKS